MLTADGLDTVFGARTVARRMTLDPVRGESACTRVRHEKMTPDVRRSGAPGHGGDMAKRKAKNAHLVEPTWGQSDTAARR